MRRIVLAWLLGLAAVHALAQEIAPRGRADEYSVNLLVVGSKRYAFEGGASARNDGGAGVGVSLVRNLNDHFAVGAEATWSEFGFRSSVAPAAGNAAPGFESEGSTEMVALRLHATWYLLSGPTTPFLTAGVGVTFFDPEFDTSPPANACWIYPWYGQVCGAAAPENTLTRLGYTAALGLRVDLPHNWGFLRLLVGGEWIHFTEASSPVGYVQLRADFGARF